MIKEIIEDNYMEALLRAALLFGDLHCKQPAREITIAAYWKNGDVRHISRRCKMTAYDQCDGGSARTLGTVSSGLDYLILYPKNQKRGENDKAECSYR